MTFIFFRGVGQPPTSKTLGEWLHLFCTPRPAASFITVPPVSQETGDAFGVSVASSAAAGSGSAWEVAGQLLEEAKAVGRGKGVVAMDSAVVNSGG